MVSIREMEQNYTQLVEGCRRRDRRSMRALYDLTAPMAMGVCMRFASDRDAAQDLMQDGYIKVYEGLARLREPEKLMAWVYQVMFNEGLNHCKRNRRPEYLDEVGEEPVVFQTDAFGMEEVVLALQQLPPRQRAVFNMLEVEDMDEKEVAVRMGTPVTNVRTLMSRAKNRLKELLTK